MESQFIAWLRQRLHGHRRLLLGPGDDAAVLRLAGGSDCVITTDLLTDGVDFLLDRTDPRRIGRKALAVNLSDLAAMAARPVAAVVSLALPHEGALELAQNLFEGLLPLAERFDVAIAGGDTNTWCGPLAISITAIGETTARGPLTRTGARAGDRLLVTGDFGGSIRGKHLDFEPRVAAALLLHEQFDIHAGIDCSDGLSLDLARLCAESACGAVIDLDCVPVAKAAFEIAEEESAGVASEAPQPTVAENALRHALGDGEDFELILAAPSRQAAELISRQPLAPVRLTDIGEFVADRGLWQRRAGSVLPLKPRGWEH
jgi:thiamine-monophosphate kinase